MPMYRQPQLFSMAKAELAERLQKRVESIRHSRELVKAAIEVEAVSHVKEKIFPSAIKTLDTEEADTQYLLDHLGPADSFDLSADEVLGVRDSTVTVDVDIDRLRILPAEQGSGENFARKLVIPASQAGLADIGAIRAARKRQ